MMAHDEPIDYELVEPPADILYPVDSTYHRCCQSIGRHSQDCAALTPPTWCEPGTRPTFAEVDGRSLPVWSRYVGPGVMVFAVERETDDGQRCIDAPRILCPETGPEGITGRQALEHAAALVDAELIFDYLDEQDSHAVGGDQ